MIFDIVLRSRMSGEGGYRAEAMGGTRSVASSRAEARTSGNRVGNERQTEVGHATLLFCAEGVNVRTTGAEEGNENEGDKAFCDSASGNNHGNT